jgi:hypothetical protein
MTGINNFNFLMRSWVRNQQMKFGCNLKRKSSVYPDQVGWMLYDELDEKETFWGLKKVPEFKQWQDELVIRYHPGLKPLKKDYTNLPVPPVDIGELRSSEYDQAMRFYTTRFDKWRDQEVSKRTEFQKAQGWLYLQMCSSFTKTNLVKIKQYEAIKFCKDVMTRNPTFLIDAPEVIRV